MAKFTDEGWYASGAINRIVVGSWVRPLDFNTFVGVPLWSFLLYPLFHLGGIDIAWARDLAVLFFAGSVFVAYFLLRTAWSSRDALWLPFLVATNPLFYFFSRLALLEAPLIFFFSASLLVAAGVRLQDRREVRAFLPRLLLVGALFTLAFASKWSAIFLLPALMYLLWSQNRSDRRWPVLLAIPLATCAALAAMYWALYAGRHAIDVLLLAAANPTEFGVKSIDRLARSLYHCVSQIDRLLVPLAFCVVLASAKWLRSLWQVPLFGCCIVWITGYMVFMVVHFDSPPRYLAVLVIPLLIVLLLGIREIQQRQLLSRRWIDVVLSVALLWNVSYVARKMLHAEDSMAIACRQIAAEIKSHPEVKPLAIGRGASEEALFADIPVIDTVSTGTLAEKLDLYRPGWILMWERDLILIDKPALHERFNVIPAGSYPAYRDKERGPLRLFMLKPKAR